MVTCLRVFIKYVHFVTSGNSSDGVCNILLHLGVTCNTLSLLDVTCNIQVGGTCNICHIWVYLVLLRLGVTYTALSTSTWHLKHFVTSECHTWVQHATVCGVSVAHRILSQSVAYLLLLCLDRSDFFVWVQRFFFLAVFSVCCEVKQQETFDCKDHISLQRNSVCTRRKPFCVFCNWFVFLTVWKKIFLCVLV